MRLSVYLDVCRFLLFRHHYVDWNETLTADTLCCVCVYPRWWWDDDLRFKPYICLPLQRLSTWQAGRRAWSRGEAAIGSSRQSLISTSSVRSLSGSEKRRHTRMKCICSSRRRSHANAQLSAEVHTHTHTYKHTQMHSYNRHIALIVI